MRPLPKEPEEARNSKSKSKHKKSKDHEKPNISYPTKFTHVVHVGFDDESGEFTGMPEAWARLLVASNISKEMQKKNPQAILDVLNYFEHSSKHKTDEKFMTHTSSTDPSPRPSYSVSSQALSSPSSAHGLMLGAAAHSPPVSFAAAIAAAAAGGNANIPSSSSPLHADALPAAAAAAPAIPTRQTSSSSTPSVFSTTPDQEEPEEEEEEEPAPPPIASRPERTKSIYTKPIDEDDETEPNSLRMPPTIDENEMLTVTTGGDKSGGNNLNNNNNVNNSSSTNNSLTNNKANSERQKKKKMTDEEILAKLRTIVTVGDPNRKYTKMEKIGQGASGTVYTAIETATGMEVRI